ncbi:MAG: hypothetical protein ACTS3R_16760 [Inquilinaceae bacterium]
MDQQVSDVSERPAALSQTNFGRLVGMAQPTVNYYVGRGLPIRPDGKIDTEAGLAWVKANVPGQADGPAPAGGLVAAKAGKEDVQRKLLELDLARKSGDLVDRRAAEAAIFKRARLERDAHQAWTVRVAPILAAELGVDQGRMFDVLDREMRRHLDQLAETPAEALGDG